MAKIQDIRTRTPKRSSKRNVSSITKIARHHSATEQGDFWSFWNNRWRGLGWLTGGYHEIILRDGTVQLCYDPNMVTNGVLNHNANTYHICVVGNGSFTDAQEKAFDERAKLAIKKFGLSVNDVLGHQEFKGASTSCPGIDMNKVRARLKGNNSYIPPKKQTASTTVTKNKKVNVTVDGKWGKEVTRGLQIVLGTPVDGMISNQLRNSVTLAMYGCVQFGKGGSPVIKALQTKIGSTPDGYAGPDTARKLQKYLGTPVDGVISQPSSVMVKELQRRLNAGTF